MLDPGMILIESLQRRARCSEFRIEFFQSCQCAPRFINPSKLRKPCNNVGQAGEVVSIETPRPLPDFHRLGIVPQLVMCCCQAGEPDKQARISRAESYSFFYHCEPGFRLAPPGKHCAKH